MHSQTMDRSLASEESCTGARLPSREAWRLRSAEASTFRIGSESNQSTLGEAVRAYHTGRCRLHQTGSCPTAPQRLGQYVFFQRGDRRTALQLPGLAGGANKR